MAGAAAGKRRMLRHWGQGLLIGGLIGLAVSVLPAIVLSVLPSAFGEGFLAVVAVMLPVTVGPLAVLSASAGAILLLVWWLSRLR